MKLYQTELTLPSYKRGYHLITDHILRMIPEIITKGQMICQLI